MRRGSGLEFPPKLECLDVKAQCSYRSLVLSYVWVQGLRGGGPSGTERCVYILTCWYQL